MCLVSFALAGCWAAAGPVGRKVTWLLVVAFCVEGWES